jgi:FkbM family methyltransferase
MSKEFWEENIYSRGELDKLIYENFINQKLDDGIVLEIGGHDGGWLSISNFFEKQLGFKAILIEPIKELYEISKIKRPDAMHFNYAVSKSKGKQEILKPDNLDIQEISSLAYNCHNEWKNTWNLTNKELVECLYMSDITAEANIKYIDLFVIDVEGNELDVLETFDWDNVEVGVISIELLSNLENYCYFKNKDSNCREILTNKGFIHKATLCGDEFWINPNYSRIDKLYKKHFDIVIPVGPKDINIIKKQILYTKNNVKGYRNIYLIPCDKTLEIEGCITIFEDLFPFSIETINQILGCSWRNGWYLQQLLKLYSGFVIPDILDKYLVIDCDTFFLKPTIFYQNGKCLYNYGSENYQPYFEHMSKLDKNLYRQIPDKSGICHHMMFETKYIKELFDIVENNHSDLFYNIFIKNVIDRDLSGASEYEIYFNFMLYKYPNEIELRYLTFKNAELFENVAECDYASYHWHMRK